MPRVAICIINYKGWQDTIECLKSLDELTYPNAEVVLVENGSGDDSRFKLESFFKQFTMRPLKIPDMDRLKVYNLTAVEKLYEITGWKNLARVTFIISGENLGFAGGNNLAVNWLELQQGKPEYYLFLNNDTTVEPDFLAKLIAFLRNPPKSIFDMAGRLYQNPKLGIVGPKILNFYDHTRIWFIGGRFERYFTRGVHIGYDKKDNQPQKPFLVDYYTGCALMVKREVLQEIGLMREDYFMYYEDADWCLRARQKGWLVGVEPQAVIYHKASRTTQAESPFYIYYMVRNGFSLAKRHAPSFSKLAAYVLSLLVFTKQLLKLIYSPRNRKWALAIMKGVKDFWLGKMGKTVLPCLLVISDWIGYYIF